MAETATEAAGASRVAGSTQPLLVVDEHCVCVEASLGACRLLGLARSEVVGRGFEDLLEAGSGERFAHVWRAFEGSGGHAESFTLAGSANEIGITVRAGVLPDRHLIRLDSLAAGAAASEIDEPAASPFVNGDGEPGAETAAGQREPTAREREILALLAGGSTDGQIATLLRLSPATVQTHVRNAKAKLGARTRAQAVALAIQRELITPR